MDWFNVTAEQLLDLKWRKWSKDTGLLLCPESQFASLPDGIALYSIFGDVKVKGRDYIDEDTRGGCLAYGIIPGRTRTDVTAAEVATAAAAQAAEVAEQIVEAVRSNGLYVFGGNNAVKLTGDAAESSVRELLGAPKFDA